MGNPQLELPSFDGAGMNRTRTRYEAEPASIGGDLLDHRATSLHGDFDVKSKICGQAPSFFRALLRCDERKAWYILAALRSFRQTPPVVPPVADGPGVSLISACGDGEPDAHTQICGRGPEQARPAARRRNDHKLFLAPFLETTAASAMVSRRVPYNEHTTTRGGARFQCGSVIVATSLHAVDPTVDPNHDADIRIGSEAPKQRCPFLYPA
jgi:hypothetical protein